MIEIFEQLNLHVICINSIDEIGREVYNIYSDEQKLFVYNYNAYLRVKNKFSSKELLKKIKNIALLEFYTVFEENEMPGLYIRKPYDLFKIYRVLFEEKLDGYNINAIGKLLKNGHADNSLIMQMLKLISLVHIKKIISLRVDKRLSMSVIITLRKLKKAGMLEEIRIEILRKKILKNRILP